MFYFSEESRCESTRCETLSTQRTVSTRLPVTPARDAGVVKGLVTSTRLLGHRAEGMPAWRVLPVIRYDTVMLCWVVFLTPSPFAVVWRFAETFHPASAWSVPSLAEQLQQLSPSPRRRPRRSPSWLREGAERNS